MASKTKSPGLIILIVIVGATLIFGPGVCRACKRSFSSSSSNYSSNVEGKSYDGGYRIQFSDSFKNGLVMQDDLGISILLAIDCSGSMDEFPGTSGDERKYVIASQALTEIMAFLEDFYINTASKQNLKMRIGLVRFSGNVEVLSPIETMNRPTFSRMRTVTSNIDNFTPQDMTAIGKALEVGTEMLAQSGTIFKSLIVITDGENTEGVDPADVLSAIVENKNNRTTEDFPISTDNILVSFVGFDIEGYTFSDLGDMGARVTVAQDKQELQDVLKNIFMVDITKLEAK